MGITNDSLNRLNRFGLLNPEKPYKMLELGCQNIYGDAFGTSYGSIAKDFFKGLNIEHTSWDICGCQGSEIVDLRLDINVAENGQFDVITNFGTTEHIENTEIGGFYEGMKNIHNLCKIGGYMIHENPKTGNWIGHGVNYVTEDFYRSLANDMGYQILELTEHFAMGNITDGCNICSVLVKVEDKPFVTKEIFETYDVRKS